MFSNTLESILSGFTKLDTKLEKFIVDTEAEHQQVSDNINNLEVRRLNLINDKTRARKVQTNIKKILGE